MSKCILCDVELTEAEEYNGELFCVTCDGPHGGEAQSLEAFDAFRHSHVPFREAPGLSNITGLQFCQKWAADTERLFAGALC